MSGPSPEQIAEHITRTLEGVVPTEAWGETAFFYNPGQQLKRGTYFATLKQKDGDNDRASALDRDGVFRLNIGLPVPDYTELFGERPARPPMGEPVTGPWDFTALDTLMPHPTYAWMGWVAVLNPSRPTFELCVPMLASAHAKAEAAFEKRIRKQTKERQS